MRILNKQVGLRDIQDLGFSPEDRECFLDLIHRSTGMLLVTGPTGSGKTSTLYAALQEIHDRSINVITGEGPVEYELDGMSQVQLLDAVGFGFPQTLRHILRQDRLPWPRHHPRAAREQRRNSESHPRRHDQCRAARPRRAVRDAATAGARPDLRPHRKGLPA
jgi:energy-coupling factor transporter ATP-binding protein EcfA2